VTRCDAAASIVPVPEAWRDGVVVDCRPTAGPDGKTIHADLRIELARLERPVAVKRAGGKGPRLHRPVVSRTGWRTAIAAEAGQWTLAGEAGPTPAAEGRRLLALVKFTPTP
jgi:hypothetical protein